MKHYPVPYSSREETPFIFKLSVREMIWIGGGIISGFVLAIMLFTIAGINFQNMIFCLPAMLPTTGLGWYLAKKTVTEDDNIVTMDRHLLKKIKYKLRPHKYLNYRK